MTNIFDLFDPQKVGAAPTAGTDWAPDARLRAATAEFAETSSAGEMLLRATSRHMQRMAEAHGERARAALERLAETVGAMTRAAQENTVAEQAQSYAQDSAQRMALMLDVLRERGDIFLEHEAAGCPPVLSYDYEVVLDGADLERPCNYQLLRILPPAGLSIDEARRPYIIIDPRAGHGAGIGGFKPDSQVGVALKAGHPVYFVSFRRMPERGQTLAEVTRAEAEFVREVQRRHPHAPKPVVTGNCQGGWATLLLGATNPDITGPLCLNGAPVDAWAGKLGENPMRYNGGVLGGTWQPMFWSDMGAGLFDGAHLVSNFEALNPSRNFFRKYFDLYQKADTEGPRFLEFERWWGGFFLLNEAEIRWIVEQIFVGNKIVRNEARLEPGRQIDVKAIRAPIIVFASHGDNITPPQQALNWIVDSYADDSEIRIRGQRIIYMVHDEVGHLGIFVSSKIAKKEHTEVASTLEVIEALAPGLYEMRLEGVAGEGVDKEFIVSFHERSFDDIRALDDGRADEAPFAAVARASEIQSQLYDTTLRPVIQAMVTPQAGEISRALHPLRTQRAALSSRNPAMQPITAAAAEARKSRRPAAATNPFIQAERVWADLVEQSLDMVRDVRDLSYEIAFLSMWNTPWARAFGRPNQPGRTLKNMEELRTLPVVQSAIANMSRGGFTEAVIRMLILLAGSRGNVRRDRLARSSRVLTQDAPFAQMPADERSRVIHEQTLIVEFERERAIETLPDLLPHAADRELAAKVAQYVPGAIDEMAPHTLETLQRMRHVLGLSSTVEDVLEDPLGPAGSAQVTGTAAE